MTQEEREIITKFIKEKEKAVLHPKNEREKYFIKGEIIGAERVLHRLEVVEKKTGHWKPYFKEGLRYQCSACDSRFDTPWKYCPTCGAKMDNEAESN